MLRKSTSFLRAGLIAGLLALTSAHARADTFESDGFTIRYEVLAPGPPASDDPAGDPPTVVLIHGYLRDHADWIGSPVAKALARTHRVVALDIRGHGGSDRSTDAEMHGDAAVEDVRRLLDHLGVDRADVVGYSMGGLIALRLAVLHPERVDEVVVGGAGFDEGFDKTFDAQIETLTSDLRAGRGFAKLFTFIAPEGPELPAEVIEQINEQIFEAASPEQWAASLEGFLDWQYDDAQLRACTARVLFVCGDRDPFIAAARGGARLVPGSKLIMLEGVDHGQAMGTTGFTEAVDDWVEAD